MKLIQFLAKHPKKHIVFDFDETLFIISTPWEIWRKEMRVRLAPLDKEIINRYEGKSTVLMINEFVTKYGDKARNIVIPYMEYFETRYARISKRNIEILSFIKKTFPKYTFHIWSSNMGNTIEKVLKQHGVHRYFKKIVGRDRVILTKPHPEGFKHIFDPQKHKLSDFIFVGDSVFDEMAATSCKIDYLKIQLKK